jgi:hypothetical protein
MGLRILLVAVSSALSIGLLATAAAQTQTWDGNRINGVPASVTSFGFGGHPGFHGVPASVTSLNFGAATNANAWNYSHGGYAGRSGAGERRHHRNGTFVNPYYGGAYYGGYFYPGSVIDPGYQSSFQQDEQPLTQRAEPDPADQLRQELNALTSSVRDYRNELQSSRVTEQREPKPTTDEDAAPQPQTVLVFKDGHQAELSNYAIVGNTLYDLSAGHTKKIGLAELDVPATVKQNNAHGVDFRVPATLN